MSLPKQLPDWSDLIGAYRFLSNPKVRPRQILRPHQQLVRAEAAAAAHEVVLCVQDDTELDFTCRTGIRGLGITGDGGGRGLLQHAALAVAPEGKRLLGVLDLAWHAVKNVPEGETRRQRQRRWTKHDVWQEAAEAIGAWAAGSLLVHVGDRHADCWRFLNKATELGHGFVVRAMHDRWIDESTLHLWEKLCAQPPLAQPITVSLGAQRSKGNQLKRAARNATLTVRSAPVQIPPSRNDPRNAADAKPLNAWAVYLKEENPPAGVEAVEWMLLSSLPAATAEQAATVIHYYTCRWVIEEWHRCLKQGCRLEDSQLDQAADIQRLAAIKSVLAVRLLQVRDLADLPQDLAAAATAAAAAAADSPQALQARVPSLYLLIVAGLAKLQPDQLTPKLFLLTIAKRGGYLARKHDRRPGWIVLWRGWSDIIQMAHGAEIYQRYQKQR